MAARGQLQIFLWAQKLQNLSQKLFKFYYHIPHDVEMCKWFFKGLLKFKLASYFLVGEKTEKLRSVIIHIVQSHYPPSGNVHVILLKFKMATTNRLFKYL